MCGEPADPWSTGGRRLPGGAPGDPGRADAQLRGPAAQSAAGCPGCRRGTSRRHRASPATPGRRSTARPARRSARAGRRSSRPGGVGRPTLGRAESPPPPPVARAVLPGRRAPLLAALLVVPLMVVIWTLPGTGADTGSGGTTEPVSCHPFPRPVRHRALLGGRERRRGTTGPRLLPQRSARRAEGSWSGREETAREAPTLSCRTGRGTSKHSPPQADLDDGAAGATRSVARRVLLATPAPGLVRGRVRRSARRLIGYSSAPAGTARSDRLVQQGRHAGPWGCAAPVSATSLVTTRRSSGAYGASWMATSDHPSVRVIAPSPAAAVQHSR